MPGKPRYLNRELSWLEFNQRVLDEAACPDNPPLERLKFLAITASNLDEFFMVRVGGLRQLAAGRGSSADPTGMTPDEQLVAIADRTHRMAREQYALLAEIEPLLAEAGLRREHPERLADRQARHLDEVFSNEVYGVVTPLAVRADEPFPPLAGLALNVCVRLGPDPSDTTGRSRFAVISFGRNASRFITLPSEGGGGLHYLLLEDAVRVHAERMFPGEAIVECVPFRVTLNADLALREDQAGDLLSHMREVLDARKESDCARLEIADETSDETLRFLKTRLDVDERDVYRLPGPLDLSAFFRFSDVRGFDKLRNEPWPPQPAPSIDPTVGMFETIGRGDVLLYHPYESFEPVVRLIEEAAVDPDVLAIKQTLYRTSRDSPIVAALARAAENGKNVTAVVELKARFDEARNIAWAENLERAGVQVIYGVKGFKTHAKVVIIVRREPHGVQRYCHFGTGNYNESTARLYSDVSLLTSDEDLCSDAVAFFNAITGYSQPQSFRKLDAAPIGLRERLLELIEGETERSRQGQRARIDAKLNSLVDSEIIDALYAASQAGVKVRLNVRGVCCLRPGTKGLSENIRVISIIDRFLEHARIFYFRHGGDERVFLSSADWMPRNLDRRVELLVPIEVPALRKRLLHILNLYYKDNVKARELKPDGTYKLLTSGDRQPPFRSQAELFRETVEAVRRAELSARTVFEPHLPEPSGPST
ncbi:MAG: polyphosphate kinase 1 [Planctomycetaceae bacterium]